ncbi:MAG: hypothetical protein H6832_00595 [Planctomycetes bacterium]|nr:hypothetical protein [Planctomycetota bacterium]
MQIHFFLCLLTLAASTRAQSADNATVPNFRCEACTTVSIDATSEAGSVWARGRDYKARIDTKGLDFYPIFGTSCPQNPRFALSYVATQFDGEATTVGPRELVAFDGRRATWDYGTTREHVDLRPEGVEQIFVIDARPGPNPRQLEVTVEVDSELRFAHTDQEKGLVFEHAGFGGITYGLATVFDARGHSANFAPVWRDERIHLCVPADFLAGAAFPLTIDPVIKTFAISTTSIDEVDPDVAYDAGSDTWIVVYEERVSAIDSDIAVRRFDRNGVQIDLSFVEHTNAIASLPGVANNRTAGQFLIVWKQFTVRDRQDIMGIGRNAATGTYGGSFKIADFNVTNGLPEELVVGGTADPGSNDYFVAWRQGIDPAFQRIMGRVVSTTGRLGATVQFDIARCAQSVAVNKCSGARAAWVITWETRGALCNRGRIHFAAVDARSNTIQAATILRDVSATAERPAVAGDGTDFLVAWEEEQGGGGFDIHGQLLRRSSTNIVQTVGTPRNLTGATLSQTDAALDYDGLRFALTYSETQTTGRALPFASTLLRNGDALEIQTLHELLASSTTQSCSSTRIASKGGAGGPRAACMAVWQQISTNSNAGRDIFGAFYEARANSGGVTYLPSACKVAGDFTITVNDPATVGLDLVAKLAGHSGAPILFLGTETTPLPLCNTISGTCSLRVSSLMSFATASVQIPIPARAELVGAKLVLQGFEVFAVKACPASLFGFTFATSNAARVVLR